MIKTLECPKPKLFELECSSTITFFLTQVDITEYEAVLVFTIFNKINIIITLTIRPKLSQEGAI